jgi:hypothetical protein
MLIFPKKTCKKIKCEMFGWGHRQRKVKLHWAIKNVLQVQAQGEYLCAFSWGLASRKYYGAFKLGLLNLDLLKNNQLAPGLSHITMAPEPGLVRGGGGEAAAAQARAAPPAGKKGCYQQWTSSQVVYFFSEFFWDGCIEWYCCENSRYINGAHKTSRLLVHHEDRNTVHMNRCVQRWNRKEEQCSCVYD